jgi:hypothetical protein
MSDLQNALTSLTRQIALISQVRRSKKTASLPVSLATSVSALMEGDPSLFSEPLRPGWTNADSLDWLKLRYAILSASPVLLRRCRKFLTSIEGKNAGRKPRARKSQPSPTRHRKNHGSS